MLNRPVRTGGALALALSLIVFCMPSTAARAAEPFFKDKTVTVVVPVGPGGTYHVYAQILARHLTRHVPGNPTVIVQNRPGGGGATSAAYMANVAPKDGTVIGKIVPGMLTHPLVRDTGYDATRFQYLGAIAARDFSIAVWHESPAKTWEDLKKHEITFGATGRAASSYVVPAFINGVLGTKIKIVTGYGSGGDLNIAMERGETQGRGNFYSGFSSVRPDWIKDRKIRFLLTMGPKNPALAGVPRVRDLLKPGSMEMKTFDLLEASFNLGQAFYLPEGAPADRVEVMRKAFWATMMDPKLKAECEQRRVDYGPVSAEDLRRVVTEGMEPARDPEVVKKFRTLMGAKES
jgi:tripartite-type tricarboxylate transporter receptor subunit TctC